MSRPLSSFLSLAGMALALGTPVSAQTAGPTNPEAADNLRTRYNTAFGPIGLLTVPTAYVAGRNQAPFGVSFGRNFKTVSTNYGIANSVDVGLAVADQANASVKFLGNAKVNIIPQNFRNVQFGIGTIDLFDAVRSTFYAVASADFATPDILRKYTVGLRAHAGYGSGVYTDSFIGGVELVFNRKFSLVTEFDGTNVNAAVRYAHNTNFGVQLGFQRNDIFFNSTYNVRF